MCAELFLTWEHSSTDHSGRHLLPLGVQPSKALAAWGSGELIWPNSLL
jgi:hypothetical protein